MKANMNRTMAALGVAAALAMLAGCAAGPDYRRPAVELPAAYAPAPGNAVAATTSTDWWMTFNDPALNRLEDEALRNNLDLAAGAARVAEARALLGIAQSDLLPTVYGTAGRDRTRSSAATAFAQPGIPLETTTNRAALNISYEIDFWGKYRRATEAARADLLSVQANRDALRLSLTAQVAQGYFGLLALDAQIAATELAITRGQEALDLQKKRFDAGVISEFDYQQRSAEVDAARAQLPPLQSQRGRQERALNVLLGRSPRAVIESAVERTSTLTPGSSIVAPAGLPSELLLQRPDLVEAEQKLIAANARIGAARAAYFPSISLTGMFGSESAALGDLFSGPARVWSFAGSLTQPLWASGRLNRQVDAAEARNEQALAQYRNAIANAFREVQDAIAAQAAAKQVFEIEQRRVASLSQTWNLAKLRYANGIASQLDVIDAERNLLLAELNRIEAERTLRTSVTDLYRALGGGGPAKG